MHVIDIIIIKIAHTYSLREMSKWGVLNCTALNATFYKNDRRSIKSMHIPLTLTPSTNSMGVGQHATIGSSKMGSVPG